MARRFDSTLLFVLVVLGRPNYLNLVQGDLVLHLPHCYGDVGSFDFFAI
jgi:hypothetical protein